MEEIEKGLNQSMAEIFEIASPIAKKRDELYQQIEDGKILLNKIKEGEYNLIAEYLKIFYSNQEFKKQVKRLEKLNETQILTSLYSIMTFRMDRYEKIKSEIQDITEN
jgi:pyruvate/2-oxoacid:ferredoxin oxidoreductase beta subunit